MFPRAYFGDDLTRPEGPASKLRKEIRHQAREDARRMVVQPKGPQVFTHREPYKSLPRLPVRDVPDIITSDDKWLV